MPSHEPGQITDRLPVFIFSIAHSGVIVAMNTPMLRSIGYTAEEIIGKKRLPEILTPGARIFYDTHFFPLIRMHGEFHEIFLSLRTRDGSDIPVLLNAATDSKGERIECVAMRVDQRSRFERELLEARRAAEDALLSNRHLKQLKLELEQQQEFLERRLQNLSQQNSELRQINSILSHDLQEPLRKIALFSRILTEEGMGLLRERWSSHLNKISNSADSMRGMMVSIRQFLEIGDREPKMSVNLLRNIIADARTRTSPVFEGINVVLECDDAPLFGDCDLLTRLFCELLDNSARFRDPGNADLRIMIRAQVVQENFYREIDERYHYREYTRIDYSDNGIGFPVKFSEEIFILFRKAHLYNEGQGVGLAICKKIAALHHGTIHAAPGEVMGSTFTLLLPLPGEITTAELRPSNEVISETISTPELHG